MCRQMPTRKCPPTGCPADGPCARFESDDETPWLGGAARIEPKMDEPGPVELAVESDLAGSADKVKPGKLALAQLARKLARVIDRRGDEESASQTAKAVDTLRILMNQIMSGEDANPDEQSQLARILGSPSAGGAAVSAEIRYPKEPRADDAGTGGREDSDGVG
jgi:hypothetical protein